MAGAIRTVTSGRWAALVPLGQCILIGATVFSLQGCAAVFRDSKATVYVSSAPEGATIDMAGRTLGTTPGEARVPRQGPNIVHVKKDGYDQGQFVLDRSVSGGWLVWDVLTCVIPVMLCIPLLVDGATGAWMNVDDRYAVTLTRQRAPNALPVEPPPRVPSPELRPPAAAESLPARTP
jgi:hypothetical protein